VNRPRRDTAAVKKGQVHHTGADQAQTKRHTTTRRSWQGWNEKRRNPLDGNQEEMQRHLLGCTETEPQPTELQNASHRRKRCTIAGQRGGRNDQSNRTHSPLRKRGICSTPRLTECVLPSPSLPRRTCTSPRTKRSSKRKRPSEALP